jgi:hypothetical protein
LGWLADMGTFVNMERYPEAQKVPQLLIVRLGAPLFADNAQAARNLIRDKVRAEASPPRVVLFDLETTTNLDIESIDKLEQMHRELGEDNIQLWLARLHDEALDMAIRSELVETIGREHIYAAVDKAADAFLAQSAQAGVQEREQERLAEEREIHRVQLKGTDLCLGNSTASSTLTCATPRRIGARSSPTGRRRMRPTCSSFSLMTPARRPGRRMGAASTCPPWIGWQPTA